MKNVLLILFVAFVTNMSLLSLQAKELRKYTTDEVAKHNTIEDCYMIFQGKVYNFTKKLSPHKKKFMDISPWCGKDITTVFKTKNKKKHIDHKPIAYEKLSPFLIGVL